MRNQPLARRAALFLPFLGITGCVAPAQPPSLAPRAVERFSVTEPEPAPPEPVLPADASRLTKISAMVAAAEQSSARFDQIAADTAPAISGGAASTPGSEAWVRAEQALSQLRALRASVSERLADIDALAIAARDGGTVAGELAALDDASARITALSARIDQRIGALESGISAP